MLEPLLLKLAASNPAIIQAISQNPVFLASFLGGGDDDGDYGAEGDGEGEGGLPPGAIQVTPEEHAAIERLVALGFEKSRAVEAFFACDKNEQLAANYLFDNAGEEDF